jgi:CDP-glucose 4,6-dehydratase
MNIEGKIILITGGKGFLGSYMAERFLSLGAKSIVIPTRDIKSVSTLEILGIANSPRVSIIKGDIRDYEFLRMLFCEYEPDVVAHLAALSEVRKCQDDAKLALDINLHGTISLLEIIRLYGHSGAVIVASSDKAYGKGELPYKEGQPLHGGGVYEVSKSCMDMIARAYASNYGLPVVVTRCCNLYGGYDLNFSRIIPNTIRQLLRGQRPLIWTGSELARREFLYIDDAVSAYQALIESIEIAKGEAYNVGGGDILSIGYLVDSIISAFGTDIKPEYRTKDFPEISDQYLDSNKITEEIGWEATTDFATGLSKTIEDYKSIKWRLI